MTQLKNLTFDGSAASAWYHFTEAWLLLNGGLSGDNFSTTDPVVHDTQVDYSDKVHNHDGINGRSLAPFVVKKEHLDPNSTKVLFSTLFISGTSLYLLMSGTTAVQTNFSDGNHAGEWYYGYTAFDLNWSTGDTDIASLGGALFTPSLLGVVCSVPYLAAYAAKNVYPPIIYGSPTGLTLTSQDQHLSNITVNWIGVWRV